MIRVDVKPTMLRWAAERANLAGAVLERRFPKLEAWERGDAKPSLKQLEAFAKAVFVPIGYLFPPEPPSEPIPIADFRSGRSPNQLRLSPNLLDTIYVCQARQAWYHDYARSSAEPTKAFVGSMTIADAPERAGAAIRNAIGFDLEARRTCPTWTEALRHFISQADAVGILVMCSGVVFNNNRRRLDPGEFRGFAMADERAPLVFINGADTKAGQMFTLAHELAHLWLGETALSDADPSTVPDQGIEAWCNRVAAELLVPLDVFRLELQAGTTDSAAMSSGEVGRLAHRFKVSTLVILRRMLDACALSRPRFHEAYEAELARLADRPTSSGGNFYLTQAARVSKRFASALIESTLEGRTLYRDAFRMLGISRVETFHELGRSLRFPI